MQYSRKEFETLYKQCFTPAIHLAMKILQEEEEARDIVHEVFLKLWESHIRIDNPAAFVVRAVRNASLNRINLLDTREKIRRRLPLEEEDDETDIEALTQEIQSAIAQALTAREREVVDRIFRDGMSYKEAAENIGVSVATINKNIVTALKKLRTRFKTR